MVFEEELGARDSAGAEPEERTTAEPVVARRRLWKRLQVGEWYVTMALTGALAGLFVAGLLVALNQAFPEGGSGGMNGGVLTGVSIGIIVGGAVLGAVIVGMGKFAVWGWRRVRAQIVSLQGQGRRL